MGRPAMQEKLCSKCERILPRESFYISGYTNKSGRSKRVSGLCKGCGREQARKRLWQRAAKGLCYRCPEKSLVGHRYCAECLAQESIRTLQAQRKAKEEAVILFGGKCSDCGLVTKKYGVYDFHHLDPTKKEFHWAEASKQNLTPKLLEELKKCILLCSNCHKIRHWDEVTRRRCLEVTQ